MKYLIALFILLNTMNSVSQTGTIVLAIVATDSKAIFMAADSRGCIFETDHTTKKQIAYVDSLKKIYTIKQFSMGIAGPATIGNDSYDKILKSYNSNSFYDTSLTITFLNFIKYLDSLYPKNVFTERIDSRFVCAGYVNKVPQILLGDSTINATGSIGCMASNKDIFKYMGQPVKYPPAYPSQSKFSALADLINEFAIGENKTSEIGGPVSIISIDTNNFVHYEQNDFSLSKFQARSQFVQAIKDETIKVYYLIPNGKERVLKLFGR